MAEQLCELKKKGGGGSMSETVLWTNPSPTSNFDSQIINLSQSIDGFKYIQFEFKGKTTSSETSKINVTPQDLLKSTSVSGSPCIAFGGRINVFCARIISSASSTSLGLSDAKSINNGTAVNNACIPVQIKGLK